MINSKQRAQLRSLANGLNPVILIGKDGLTPGLLEEIDNCLTSHELIKIKLLETSLLTPKEAAAEICQALSAEPVQCIGAKLVVYRENPENKQIELAR